MRRQAILLCATVCTAHAAACGTKDEGTGGTGSAVCVGVCPGAGTGGAGAGGAAGTGAAGTGAGTGGAASGACAAATSDSFLFHAHELNNYSFMSTLMVGEVAVTPRAELSFDWSALTTDFSMHEISPLADIDMVSVIIWRVSNAELAVKLNIDDLSQDDFEAIAMIYTENAVTDGTLFQFTEFGAEIDPATLLDYLDPAIFEPATHAYTIMASTGTTPGKGTRMLQGFRMDETSTNTHVAMDRGSTTMDYTVDLLRLQPVEVPASARDITVDWSQIATNAMGAEFDPTAITEVVVGKFSFTTGELQEQFLDLDLIADDLYWGDVAAGSSFSLADTETKADQPAGAVAGAPFPGIDDTGTWLIGLRCGTCTNPAPWFMTVLRPCAAAPAPATGP